MSEQKFNAAEHLINLKGKEYLEVRWRLVWLRTDYPEAQVETFPVSIDPDLAIVRCKVTLPNGACGSGIGSESPRDFGDYIEKAETKAIGRALGTLGFGTQFTEDFDTPIRANGEPSLADAPVVRTPKQPTNAPKQGNDANWVGPNGITGKQRGMIMGLCAEKGLTDDVRHGLIGKNYGRESLNEMTKAEASNMIERLQAMPIYRAPVSEQEKRQALVIASGA